MKIDYLEASKNNPTHCLALPINQKNNRYFAFPEQTISYRGEN